MSSPSNVNDNIITYLRIKDECVTHPVTVGSIQMQDKVFLVDHVMHRMAQEDVYQQVLRNGVSKCLQGYNCSVFSYGQTGSGKTYTIQGNDNEPGLVQRSLAFLHNNFDELNLSFIEIYNETMIDLYNQNNNITIREDPKDGVVVDGLTVVKTISLDESLAFFEKGAKNRKTACTAMNTNSSRSHSVFMISMECKDGNLVRKSKLCFVDLAGSERLKEHESERMKESCNINKSLLYLGKIVHKLGSNNRWHVSYRDSKLTFLLKDSLGGNCRLLIIGNVCLEYQAETVNTLQFLERAKLITNNPLINYDLEGATIENLEKTLRKLDAENQKLKAEVSELRVVEEITVKESFVFSLKKLREEIHKVKDEFLNVYERFNQITRRYFDENKRLILDANKKLEDANIVRKENINNIGVKRNKTE